MPPQHAGDLARTPPQSAFARDSHRLKAVYAARSGRVAHR
jgi:hypothetical protein